MTEREKVINGLEWCMNERHDCYREKGCPYENVGDDVGCKYALHKDAIALLKAQEQVINDMYSRYEGLCKEKREKYESDDVCGLCQYDGAYVGDSGDWMNECPGFGTNDCFCMKNSVRKMCGQPLIEEP